MAKLTLETITQNVDDANTIAKINDNFTAIEDAFDQVVSRDGSTPNYMDATLDMNGNKIINVMSPTTSGGAATKGYVDAVFNANGGTVIVGVEEAPVDGTPYLRKDEGWVSPTPTGVGWVQTAQELAAGVTPTNIEYPELNLLRYGTNSIPGTTDMLSAFNSWIAVANQHATTGYASVQTGPKMTLPAGLYYVSDTINMDIPDGTTVEFIGTICTDVSGSTRALKIGSTAGNTWNLNIMGLKIYRTSMIGSSGSAGVEMYNLVNCKVDIRQVWNFTVGVVCHGTNGYGFGYNQIHLGTITDNQVNLQLWVTTSGWCNENSFYGGSYGHSTSFDAAYPTLYTINIEVIHDATHPLNNNVFFHPSLEDNIATYRRAAIISGVNNWLVIPRMENPGSPTGYQIEFTANSTFCGILGLGQERSNSNISDLGSANQYETYEGRFFRSATPATAGKAVLTLQSPSTSAARNLSILNSSGTETWYVTGDGITHQYRMYYTGWSGRDYVDDAAAAAGGVAIGEVYHTSGALKVRIA